MKLIKDSQTQWEVPPAVISRIPRMSGSLEPIQEDQSLRGNLEDRVVLDSESTAKSTEQIQITKDDVDHQKLWEEI